MVASSQGFCDFRTGTEIVWDRRSLQAFGVEAIDGLVDTYDLLVIDHPFIGYAARQGLLLPLDEFVPQDVLGALAAQSVGPSYRSYACGGHQWALPVDAAAQVGVSHAELLRRLGVQSPRTWDDVLDFARRTGKVAIPLAPTDALCSFLTLCANQGEPPLREERLVVSREIGELVLEQLRALASIVDPTCLAMNPIQVLTQMATTESVAYVPLCFGYSNYARRGYAPVELAFHAIPAGRCGNEGSTLGGAGLAVSSRTRNRAEAIEYAAWVASADCQRSVYVLSGGQPANRVAWEDDLANEVTHDFFRNTLPTLDSAYMRPNYSGISQFQAAAAGILHRYLKGQEARGGVLAALNHVYAESRTG